MRATIKGSAPSAPKKSGLGRGAGNPNKDRTGILRPPRLKPLSTRSYGKDPYVLNQPEPEAPSFGPGLLPGG